MNFHIRVNHPSVCVGGQGEGMMASLFVWELEMLHMYLSIFGCHGHELEQFLSNSFCTWQHGVEGVDGMDSNISNSAEFGEVKKNLFH
jgi:hypothetical protein